MRFYYNDSNIATVKVGKFYYDLSDAEKAGHYIELSRERIEQELQDNMNRVWRSGRLFIELLNKAYGRTGILVRFEKDDDGNVILSRYIIAEHYSFILSNDFEDLGDSVDFYSVNGNQLKKYDVDDYVRVKRYNDPVPSGGGGCGGNVVTTSALLASLAGVLAILIAFTRKRRKLGGKE